MNSDIIVINSLENQLKVLVAIQRYPKISEKLTDCFLFDAGRDIGCQGFFFRSEILLMLKIAIGDGLKAPNTSVSPLIPTSAQDRISAYSISTISSRQVMRIWKI